MRYDAERRNEGIFRKPIGPTTCRVHSSRRTNPPFRDRYFLLSFAFVDRRNHSGIAAFVGIWKETIVSGCIV